MKLFPHKVSAGDYHFNIFVFEWPSAKVKEKDKCQFTRETSVNKLYKNSFKFKMNLKIWTIMCVLLIGVSEIWSKPVREFKLVSVVLVLVAGRSVQFL